MRIRDDAMAAFDAMDDERQVKISKYMREIAIQFPKRKVANIALVRELAPPLQSPSLKRARVS